MFSGRTQELTLLDQMYAQKGGQLLILYGRRRIGKTALLQEWRNVSLASDNHLYWMATQTTSVNQLRDFSQVIAKFRDPTLPLNSAFSYSSWEDAFEVITQLAEKRRFVLMLDEFTYVMQANPELPSIIQRLWDHKLKHTNLFLILTGSLAGIIQRSVLDYQAPLYGRATAALKLRPLSFGTLVDLLPNMTTEQRIAVYAIAGGVPAYIERFDDHLNLISNLKTHIITPLNAMLNDGVFLLREQVEQPRTYIAILTAIAGGNHKLSEIAMAAGIERSNTNKYLSVLKELGYVDRIVPATARHPERSKQGRHVITDPYLRFYFRFLRPYLPDIEGGRYNRVVGLLEDHLTDFIGMHTFEELCRDWLAEQNDIGKLPLSIDRIGSHWSKAAQIDAVGINWRTKQILFGECKWGRQPVKPTVIKKLIAQSMKALPSKDNWQKHYILFSRAELTPTAKQLAKDNNVMVIGIEQIEKDMHKFS